MISQQTSLRFVSGYTPHSGWMSDTMPFNGRFMRYDWTNMPSQLAIGWLAYANMLDEYARALANIINDFTHHVHRLRAWAKVDRNTFRR